MEEAEEGVEKEKKKLRRQGEGGPERGEEEKTGKGCEEEKAKASGQRERDFSLDSYCGNIMKILKLPGLR